MFQPRLGVSLHTISRELTADVLDLVAASQIRTLEITPTLFTGEEGGHRKSLLKEMLRRSGIQPMTVHALFGGVHDFSGLAEKAFGEAMRWVEQSLDFAAEFDMPMIVVHASAEPIDPQERGARLKQCRRGLMEIGKRCQRDGRKVAVEILPRTCLGNTVEEMFEILDGLDERTFGICLDTNHLMDRYRDLAGDVRKLGSRLITLHLSDYDGVDEKHELPGKGVVDWKSFMAALREIGYDGPFDYESKLDGETPHERIQSLENNFRWLCGL